MPIEINLDAVLERRGMTVAELARAVDITQANIFVLKSGRAKAVRFSTLEAICRVLECQPGDILAYEDGDAGNGGEADGGEVDGGEAASGSE